MRDCPPRGSRQPLQSSWNTRVAAGTIDGVLLTISTTHVPATDLGYLLYKHPEKAQSWAVASGTAYVFYPEATEDRCTAALLLEVYPVALVGVRGNSKEHHDATG